MADSPCTVCYQGTLELVGVFLVCSVCGTQSQASPCATVGGPMVTGDPRDARQAGR